MNIKIKSLKTVLLASALALSFTANVGAIESKGQSKQIENQHKGERHSHKMRQFKKIAKYLSLSAEQKEKAKAIFRVSKTEKMVHRESLGDFKTQVNSLLNAAIFDEKAFTELHNQYQNQFTEMALLKIKKKHALLQILTQEQREKMELYKGKRQGLFH